MKVVISFYDTQIYDLYTTPLDEKCVFFNSGLMRILLNNSDDTYKIEIEFTSRWEFINVVKERTMSIIFVLSQLKHGSMNIAA